MTEPRTSAVGITLPQIPHVFRVSALDDEDLSRAAAQYASAIELPDAAERIADALTRAKREAGPHEATAVIVAPDEAYPVVLTVVVGTVLPPTRTLIDFLVPEAAVIPGVLARFETESLGVGARVVSLVQDNPDNSIEAVRTLCAARWIIPGVGLHVLASVTAVPTSLGEELIERATAVLAQTEIDGFVVDPSAEVTEDLAYAFGLGV